MVRLTSKLAVLLSIALLCTIAHAQQIGYGSAQTLPVVAKTSSYTSTVFIHNPGSSPITVNFTFQGASTSATPGALSCGGLDIAAGSVVKVTLDALCPALNPGANFGALTTGFSGQFALYSRVETPSGNGFSVEGFNDTCCFDLHEVMGLRRQAAFPTYQSNCFIYNRDGRAGRVVVTLASGDSQLIGSRIIDLQSNELIRLLDVFAELSAPAGDYDNVRAQFESITPFGGGAPVTYMAYCTVQNSTSFDADFRIAKGHF